MNALLDILRGPGTPAMTLEGVLLALLMAFILGQGIAWCYVWTHHGVSYSRNFAQALILVCLIVAMVMSVIGTNLVAAFGLLGALSIIRFRTPVRDTRDTAFIFLSLACGMAVGMGFVTVALAGALGVCLVAGYLHLTRFGSRLSSDGTLRFLAPAGALEDPRLQRVLKRFCRRRELLSVGAAATEAAGVFECTYDVQLRDALYSQRLLAELEALGSLAQVRLLLQEENDEV